MVSVKTDSEDGTESADGSAFTIVVGGRENGIKGEAGEQDGLRSSGGWQSWSKKEKSGVVAAAVLVAVGIIIVFGVVILINRKRRIQMKKMKEEEEAVLQKGNRAKGKRRKHSRGPRGIEMMEKGKNDDTALRSNTESWRAGPRQGKTRQAVEQPMMSGAFHGDQKVSKGKRTFLPPIAERRIKSEGGEDVSRRTDQTRQSPRTKGNDRDGDEGGL